MLLPARRLHRIRQHVGGEQLRAVDRIERILLAAEIAIDVESDIGVLSADGLRKVQLRAGDRILLTSEKSFIHLAHIEAAPFTDRLVAKFKLPVDGWRGE